MHREAERQRRREGERGREREYMTDIIKHM